MKYRVAVTEVYRMVVTIEAESERDAHQRASDAWTNTEFILDKDAFEGVEFHVLGEGSEGEQIDEKGVCI